MSTLWHQKKKETNYSKKVEKFLFLFFRPYQSVNLNIKKKKKKVSCVVSLNFATFIFSRWNNIILQFLICIKFFDEFLFPPVLSSLIVRSLYLYIIPFAIQLYTLLLFILFLSWEISSRAMKKKKKITTQNSCCVYIPFVYTF